MPQKLWNDKKARAFLTMNSAREIISPPIEEIYPEDEFSTDNNSDNDDESQNNSNHNINEPNKYRPLEVSSSDESCSYPNESDDEYNEEDRREKKILLKKCPLMYIEKLKLIIYTTNIELLKQVVDDWVKKAGTVSPSQTNVPR